MSIDIRRGSTPIAGIAIAALVAVPSCSLRNPDAGQIPPPRCIENWPNHSSPEQLSPLAVEMGKVLWETTVPGWVISGQPVLAGDNVAFSSGNTLWIMDRKGNVVFEYLDYESMISSGVASDPDGNIYFAASRMFSFTSTGGPRWRFTPGPNISMTSEHPFVSRPILASDGTVYLTASDGMMYAVNGQDGKAIWQQKVTSAPTPYYQLGNGVGDVLFGEGGEVRLMSTGQIAPWTRFPSPKLTGGMASIGYQGVTGCWHIWLNEDPLEYESGCVLFDRCGARIFDFPVGMAPMLVGLDGSTLVYRYDDDYQDTLLAWISSDGTEISRVLVPGDVQLSVVAGDGMMYGAMCERAMEDATLVAFSPSLEMQWSMNFGQGGCGSGHLTFLLDDTGVLLVFHSTYLEPAIEILAIQTTSPGLAKIAKPTRYYNNRGTGWME